MCDVSIILVNFKTPLMTRNAVRSIIDKSTDFLFEIIVVDNSDDEKQFEELQNNLSNLCVTTIKAPSNLGFGKANNLGASIAKGKYLYFINTDTVLNDNAIYFLKDFLDKNNQVGIVGSNLIKKDGSPNHSFMSCKKNVVNEKKNSSVFKAIKKVVFKKRFDYNFSDKPLKILGYVCGASLMVRKNLFNSIGGFDKDIFMYAEEALLCHRIQYELGYQIYNVPQSKIIHFEGGSSTIVSQSHANMEVEGNCLFYCKMYGKTEVLKYIKSEIRIFKKYSFITTLFKNDKHSYFLTYYNAYKKALIEWNKKNGE